MGADRTSFEKKSRATRRGRARTVAVLKGVVILLVLFTLPALWSWTPLNDRINLATIIEWQQSIKGLPRSILSRGCCLSIGKSFSLSCDGSQCRNGLNLRSDPRQPLRAGWMARQCSNGLRRRAWNRARDSQQSCSVLGSPREPADRHGFLTVLTVRVFPVGPFTLVNFLIGAARIRFWDFFLASVIGRIPG